MNVDQVLNEFKKSGALLEGHFILSSGLHSDKFLQKALVFQDAKRTAKLCKALAAKVKKEVKRGDHRHRLPRGGRHRAGL